MNRYNNYNKKRSVIPWIVGALIVAGLVFVFWWGMQQKSNQPAGAKSASPGVGEMAPGFNLPSADGKNIKLSDYQGKKNVLIYFNEGMTCDPCIQQMPELEKYMSDFDKLNVQLLYVAFDPPNDLHAAMEKYNIKAPLLSYNTASTERDYNLTQYSMAMERRAGHTFVLVGTDGKIIWRKDYWPGYGMMVPGGLMFVKGSDILSEVKQALGKS